MSSPRLAGFRGILCLLLLSGALGAIPRLYAADTTLTLGRDEHWSSMVLLEGLRTATGRWGELDLVLTDAAYEPEADTDLLLHFDSTPFVDSAGRYDVTCADPQVSTRERVFNAGAAAFVTPRSALRLTPRGASLFRAGTMWQDFSLELWLYPASLAEGETILSWSGKQVAGAEVLEQRLYLSFRKRRLVFRIENLFQGGKAENIELGGLTPLLPRQWHHHLLRFDAKTGLLEYLVDGVPEAVCYATDTGKEGGSIALPLVGSSSADPLVIGGTAQGCMDELRISRRFVEEPVLTRLPGRTGTATSRVFDLRLTGTSLESIEAVYDRPPETEVYFYYRMADRLKARGELETEWVPFAPGPTDLDGRGRYLQLMVELLPDGALARSPSVSSITVHYTPDLAPAPPTKLLATPLDGEVRLAWSAVNETDVAGYRVYYGSRPGVYERIVEAGTATSLVVEGLENGTIYYFTVVTYDTADTTRRSAFAPEASARPSRLNPQVPGSGGGKR